MLPRFVVLVLTSIVLLVAGVGCGASAQKGAENERDMPKSAEKE